MTPLRRRARGAAVVFLVAAALPAAAQEPPRVVVVPNKTLTPEQIKEAEESARKTIEEGRARQLKALAELEERVKKLTADPGPDAPATRKARGELGAMYAFAGRHAQALPLVEEQYLREKTEKTLDDPAFTFLTGLMARTYTAVGKYDPALAVYREWHAFLVKKYGPDHPATLPLLDAVGDVYLKAKQPEKAVALYRETFDRQRAEKVPDSEPVLRAAAGLVRVYDESGRAAEALALREDVFARWAKLKGTTDGLENARVGLAEAYSAAGKHREALAHFEALAAYGAKTFGRDSAYELVARNRIALCHQGLGDLGKALPAFDDVLARARAKLGPADATTLAVLENAARAYDAAGKHAAADAHWGELIAARRAGGNGEALGTALATLGLNRLNQKKWADAEPVLRESLALREKLMPDDWRTFNTKAMLGGALLGQGKHAAAGPLLADGYAGLKARAAAIPPAGRARLREAGERLAALYDATNRPAEAAAVRRELDAK